MYLSSKKFKNTVLRMPAGYPLVRHRGLSVRREFQSVAHVPNSSYKLPGHAAHMGVDAALRLHPRGLRYMNMPFSGETKAVGHFLVQQPSK